MWDLRAGTLEGGTDPRNPVGKVGLLPAAAQQARARAR